VKVTTRCGRLSSTACWTAPVAVRSPELVPSFLRGLGLVEKVVVLLFTLSDEFSPVCSPESAQLLRA
jgi:hypothetical protein